MGENEDESNRGEREEEFMGTREYNTSASPRQRVVRSTRAKGPASVRDEDAG